MGFQSLKVLFGRGIMYHLSWMGYHSWANSLQGRVRKMFNTHDSKILFNQFKRCNQNILQFVYKKRFEACLVHFRIYFSSLCLLCLLKTASYVSKFIIYASCLHTQHTPILSKLVLKEDAHPKYILYICPRGGIVWMTDLYVRCLIRCRVQRYTPWN